MVLLLQSLSTNWPEDSISTLQGPQALDTWLDHTVLPSVLSTMDREQLGLRTRVQGPGEVGLLTQATLPLASRMVSVQLGLRMA